MNEDAVLTSQKSDPLNFSELLTTKEVCKLYKVSRPTISKWVRFGRLPAYRLGTQSLRFRISDLQKFLKPIEVNEGNPELPDQINQQPEQVSEVSELMG